MSVYVTFSEAEAQNDQKEKLCTHNKFMLSIKIEQTKEMRINNEKYSYAMIPSTINRNDYYFIDKLTQCLGKPVVMNRSWEQ